MLKRILISIMLLTLLIPQAAFADSITMNAEVDYTTNIVTISGTVTGSGRWVTMFIEGPENKLYYIGNTAVRDNTYEVSLELLEPVDGTYTVRMKAENMAEPVSFTFEYLYTPPMRNAGIEYEQIRSNTDNLPPPDIKGVHVEVLNYVQGIYRIYLLNDDYDSNGIPFFFWSTTEGTFEKDPTSSVNYNSVIFKADKGTNNRKIKVIVGIGDGIGQSDRKAILLKGNDE